MPTTILTEGWAPAGERFRAMLARQLDGLAVDGRFDVSACQERCVATVTDPGAAPDGRPQTVAAEPDVLYGFGPPLGGRRGASAGRIAFWPATRGGSGQGSSKGRAAAMRGRVVVPSRWSRDRLVEAGLRPDLIAVVTPGVDGEIFSPLSLPDRAAVRAQLGLSEGETAFLHLGGFGPDGGADVVLRAFARLRARGAPVRLVLAADEAGETRDVERVVREAGSAEPDLLSADCLAAVVTVPSGLAAPERRLLIGAADALVSPDRATAFPFPVFEAIACGTPAVVTRGGAADDICCDDLAWRIGGELRRAPGEGCWIEPDLDELTDALAAVAEGRGFDRLRFAAARMGLLRRATWAQSSLSLVEALAGPAATGGGGGGGPFVLRGLRQPLENRFAAGSDGSLEALRRRARPAVACPAPQQLSVVVQGPCLRQATEPGSPSIDEAVASIRRNFPGAQVIVSTWLGSDIDGLDADDIVLSPDPGTLAHPWHLPNNVNRMATSTANGLAAATRPFCIKTRNDVLFASGRILARPLFPADETLLIERRIWVASIGFSRIETYMRPFHPCDMVQYGATRDLRQLWDMRQVDAGLAFETAGQAALVRMCPEQILFTEFLRRSDCRADLSLTLDVSRDVVALSTQALLGSFDVFDEQDEGVIFSDRLAAGKYPHLTHSASSFSALRDAWQRGRAETLDRIADGARQRFESIVRGERHILVA